MEEPTLGEIDSYQGNANIAGGTAGAGGAAPAPVVTQFDPGLQFLNEASQARAGYNKYLSDQYQTNLTNSLNDLNNVDFSKVLPTDLPALRQKYADLAQNVSDNFDAIRNPAANQDAWNQLQQQEADLRGDIEVSNAHNVIANQNKIFLNSNPSWVTPENQAAISNFENTPMDQRKDFLLKAPVDFDITKVADAANKVATTVTKKQAVGKDPNWINTTEAQNVNQDAYNNAVLGYAKNVSANGTTLYQKYLDNYNLMPPQNKIDANGNPITADQYILAQAAPFMNPNNSNTTIAANPFQEQKNSEAFQAQQTANDHAFEAAQNELNRAAALDKNNALDPDVAADAKMRNFATALNTGQIPNQLAQSLYGDNTLIAKTVKVPDPKNKGAFISTVAKIPATQIVRSNLAPDGTFHIVLRNNATGKLLPTQQVTSDQLYNNLDGILGAKNAPKVAEGSANFVKKYFKGNFPTSQQIQQHYGMTYMVPTPIDPSNATNVNLGHNTVAPGSEQTVTPATSSSSPATAASTTQTPPIISNQSDYNALPKGSQYTAPNGQIYTKN